jgi:hypothetical protein
MQPPCRGEPGRADRELQPDHQRRAVEDRAARQHDEQQRGQEPPRQTDQHAADDVEPAHLQQALLDRDDGCGVIDPGDEALHDAAEYDESDAVDVQADAADLHRKIMRRRRVRPQRQQHEHRHDTNEHADRLSDHKRAEAAAHGVDAMAAQQLEVKRVLLLQAAVEGLPGVLEVVEFHCVFHVIRPSVRGCGS